MAKLINYIKNIGFLMVVCFVVIFNVQIIPQETNFEDEILVYILPDSLEMPEGTKELTDVSKLKN